MKGLSRSAWLLPAGLVSALLLLACYRSERQGSSTLSAVDVETLTALASPAAGIAGREPEPPRVFLDTTYMPPTGRLVAVSVDGDLQAAINQAQPGDVITLAAGASYTGNFTLPAKAGADWIIIRTSASDSSLPPPGTRLTPAYASALPKVVTPNSAPALEALSGAHHYRIIGIEFTQAPTVRRTFNLVALGNEQTSLAHLPHDLILDRVYIHGSPSQTLRRGILLNSASTAVIDSYISDCHEEDADSQAIAGYNGPGPFKIVNNYLEGAGENFMLGGGHPLIPNLVSSDIEFRRNYCTKPLTWRVGDPSYAGQSWSIKNLFELKNAQRVLIDGNIFEHNWTHAQNGYGILFTVRTDEGETPWAVVQDVTFTNNIIRRVAAGFNMHGRDDNGVGVPSRRIRIANNLLEEVDGQRWNGPGVAFQLIRGPHDVTIENNTVFQNYSIIATGESPSNGLIFRNNLVAHNEYGVKGDGRESGNNTIDTYFPDAVFVKNVLVGAPSAAYPAENFFPSTFEQVGLISRAVGNYRLAMTSPYKEAGTDGGDIGCNIETLEAALRGTTVATGVAAASVYEAPRNGRGSHDAGRCGCPNGKGCCLSAE